MRFKSLPVTSLEDATVDFEQLQTLDILNLTAESVLQLAVTGVARKVAFGTLTATWSGAQNSAVVTVTHGLGRAPVVVLITGGQLTAGAGWNWATGTTTTFQAQGTLFAGTFTGTVAASWLAIG